MPLYEYECIACDSRLETLKRISDRNTPEPCPCGHVATRVLSSPSTFPVDIAPKYDIGLGEHITSRSHRKRVMSQKGVQEQGGSRLYGAKGTIFSFPGQTCQSVPPSGAYNGPHRP